LSWYISHYKNLQAIYTGTKVKWHKTRRQTQPGFKVSSTVPNLNSTHYSPAMHRMEEKSTECIYKYIIKRDFKKLIIITKVNNQTEQYGL